MADGSMIKGLKCGKGIPDCGEEYLFELHRGKGMNLIIKAETLNRFFLNRLKIRLLWFH